MKKKKVFEVRLISKSIQYKNILASSAEEARKLANDGDIKWNEKEHMLDSDIEVGPGEGEPGRYIEFLDEEGEFDAVHFDPEKHENATEEDLPLSKKDIDAFVSILNIHHSQFPQELLSKLEELEAYKYEDKSHGPDLEHLFSIYEIMDRVQADMEDDDRINVSPEQLAVLKSVEKQCEDIDCSYFRVIF